MVAVVVDGMLVPSAPPATLSDGRVVAPLDVVARIAERVDVAPDGVISAQRGTHRCVARPRGATPALVLLAPLARCLGARDVHWDSPTKMLALFFDGPVTIRTLPPFDPNAPRVSPTTVFTPEPGPPTPRAIVSGSPRPRRTAIPVFNPPPGAPATSPRPRAP